MDLGGADEAKMQDIIHDLRNALGLIINYANLMVTELSDRPDLLEDLGEVRLAGRRAAELVGELSTVISTDGRREGPVS